MRSLISLLCACAVITTAHAQQSTEKKEQEYSAEIHGTIRAKYEYEPDIEAGRFQVRNARFSLSGKVNPIVAYKAEIDLSDEGNIKMLDAYSKISPVDDIDFTIGQMRVPFTIDAHRSPHQQYFANRSFIAKQVGNVRDVGAKVGYKVDTPVPIILEAGLFNGSGLTEQKTWQDEMNYSAKAQFLFTKGFNLTLSVQKIKPEEVRINMYDVGAYYKIGGFHIEAEYLFKTYADDAFDDVHAVNTFASYSLPMRKVFNKVSFLARYDMMGDHSNGKFNEENKLYINDYSRQRVTGGVTFSISKQFVSDIRLNYEKYFYKSGGIAKEGEQDKIVIEFMTRF